MIAQLYHEESKKITGKHLLFKIDIVNMPCQLKIKYINHDNYKIYIILTIYYWMAYIFVKEKITIKNYSLNSLKLQ